MTRPTLGVADVLRLHGDRFLDRYRSSFDFQQLKAFRAIQRCRTAALGGHQGNDGHVHAGAVRRQAERAQWRNTACGTTTGTTDSGCYNRKDGKLLNLRNVPVV